MLSLSRNVRLSVCPSVCLSVCLFTFEVPLNGLFVPTSWSQMSNILRDSESLGKSYGKKWSNIWIFLFGSGLKSPREKKFFFADFALQNMVETTLPHGLETSGQRCIVNFGISLDVFEFLRFVWFFQFFKKSGFWGILCQPGNHASRWIRDLWSKGVSLILAYFLTFLSLAFWMIFFHFSRKSGFGVFLVHPPMALVLLSASVERCFVTRMRDFFLSFHWFSSPNRL